MAVGPMGGRVLDVAAVAARRGWPVLTDRGVDLRKLVPGLQIEPLP